MNIAARRPQTDWHLRHLYNPQKEMPGSIMAPYSFLFDKRKIVGQPSPDALKFPATWSIADGAPEGRIRGRPHRRRQSTGGVSPEASITPYEIAPAPAGGKP